MSNEKIGIGYQGYRYGRWLDYVRCTASIHNRNRSGCLLHAGSDKYNLVWVGCNTEGQSPSVFLIFPCVKTRTNFVLQEDRISNTCFHQRYCLFIAERNDYYECEVDRISGVDALYMQHCVSHSHTCNVTYEADQTNFANPERGIYHHKEVRSVAYMNLSKSELLRYRSEGGYADHARFLPGEFCQERYRCGVSR